MITLDLADVVQFVALLALSIANGVIAYSVLRIQKDRNTSKLVVYAELVEDDDAVADLVIRTTLDVQPSGQYLL